MYTSKRSYDLVNKVDYPHYTQEAGHNVCKSDLDTTADYTALISILKHTAQVCTAVSRSDISSVQNKHDVV